jgi:hypothetical protein
MPLSQSSSHHHQIPCNIILKRTTPRLWLPTLTIAWGIVATLLGIVQNKAGFFVARFFLGVTESGLFPGKLQESLNFIEGYMLTRSKAWSTIFRCGISGARDNTASLCSSALPPSLEPLAVFWHMYGFQLPMRAIANSEKGIGKMAGVVWENGWRWIFILVRL